MNKKRKRDRIFKKVIAILLCLMMTSQNVAFAAEAVMVGDESSSQTFQVEGGEGEMVSSSTSSEAEIGDAISDSENSQETKTESSDSSSNSDSSSDIINSDSTDDSLNSDNSDSDSNAEEEIQAVEDFNIVLPEGKEYLEVRIGDEAFPIDLVITPEGAKPEKVEYTVANEEIAEVKDGKLIGISVPEDSEVGETELTVRVNDIEKTVKVIILPQEEKEELPFESLVVVSPESDIIKAEVGQEVTLQAEVSRKDVQISYQWQRLQKKTADKEYGEAIYDYAEGAPKSYSFAYADTTESEYLSQYPDAAFPGIEMYYAVKDALEEIGEDTSSISLAWRTPNFALEGYTVSAGYENGALKVFADKEGMRYTAVKNSEGKWEFNDTPDEVTYTWQDVEGATESNYTFTVSEKDMDSLYRCKITIVDEEYLNACLKILEGEDVTPTDEQLESDQVLYTPSYSFEGEEEFTDEEADEKSEVFMSMYSAFGGRAAVGNPKLSADRQWIEGLNGRYEYITKDTYDRVSKWLKEGKISQVQADRYWTGLLPSGFSQKRQANVLDENGFPIGDENNFRAYNGFDLTDGMLEVNSEWYGKTVYFRVDVNDRENWGNTGTAIKVPAYTELTVDSSGNYIEGASGTKYKKAITVLNPYVLDTGSKYKEFTEKQNIATGANHARGKGWILDGNTANTTDNHITVYAVDCESYNRDPQQYMVDAEGNYRVDSVAWGVCTGEEPDISGKAYWVLKDYISNGYGFMSGHDTMYAYAGAYYDAFGVDLNESSIDPNDGTTWYYDINSWVPGTTATSYVRDNAGNITGIAGKSENRGGHFYMNQLMGSNKGNIYSGTVSPYDAPSYILSLGGSHGPLGKFTMYGSERLGVVQTGYSHAQALANAKYRTPTNYPFEFNQGEEFAAALTHTNQQVAFGPLWVNYRGGNSLSESFGCTPNPIEQIIDGQKGTSNFYLSGTGNYLMNQVGHLPQNKLTNGEAKLFINSMFYISQRKQCEICAANQMGQETAHFVHRVNSSNAQQVLTALQKGGSYWYPLNDCYILTEDITLPEDWKPIKNFNGHWDSDVYKVKLNSKGSPLFENTVRGNKSSWNLGTNKAKGTEYVFDGNMTRTTGIARVVGDLNDLFGTKTSYAGYTVKILGRDNPKYMSAGEEYGCTVNTDSKYVISNLPCVYVDLSRMGVLNARVYKPDGTEVTEYGAIRANVPVEFWDNDMTTPLYLGSFGAEPANDYTTYESAQGIFSAVGVSSDKFRVDRWEYSADNGNTWQTVPEEWDCTVTSKIREPGTSVGEADNYIAYTTLILNKVNPAWDGYKFRAVFANDRREWNSYRYYWKGATASNTPFSESEEKEVATEGMTGTLTVKLWPAYAEQSPDKTINEGNSATFRAYGMALDDGTLISARWQYSTTKYFTTDGQEVFDWHYIDEDNEFSKTRTIKTQTPNEEHPNVFDYALHGVAPNNDLNLFHEKTKLHSIETELTLGLADITQSGTHFRAEFKATTAYGTEYIWYSNIADDFNGSWDTDSGDFGNFKRNVVKDNSNKLKVVPPDLRLITTKSAEFTEGAAYQDLLTPDEYGQTMLMKGTSTVANGTAAYRAEIYFRPAEMVPQATWQYMTLQDRTAKPWSAEVARSLGYDGVNVSVVNSTPVPATLNGESNWMMYTSTMTISNAPLSMYNPEKMLKYFFRCVATTSYTTSKSAKSLTATDKWGGLTMDYAIALRHNGVLKYGGKNIINGYEATDAQGVVNAASKTNSSNRKRSKWYYPNLTIKAPKGHHINTAVAYFNNDVGYNSNDYLEVDKDRIQSLGITVKENTQHRIVLVSTRENAVELDAWHTALRECIGFVSYDEGTDFSNDKVIAGTTGGGAVKWFVDENRPNDLISDIDTGHSYRLVTWNSPIDWYSAKQEAQRYNSEAQMSGYLAEIGDDKENSIVYKLAGGRNVWLGGYNRSGNFYWDSNGAQVNYLPWRSDANKGNDNLYMTDNGRWSTGPIDKTETQNYSMNCGGTNWAEANGTGHKYTDSSTVNINPAAQQVDITVSSDSNDFNRDCFWRLDYYSDGVWKSTEEFASMDYRYHTFSVYGNITAVKVVAIQHATAYSFYSKAKIESVTAHVNRTTVTKTNPVYAAVIEYNTQPLSMVVTDHSAIDTSFVGTSVKYTEDPSAPTQRIVSVNIAGNRKMYDGKEISPSSFEVSGSTGANDSLFQITYTLASNSPYANYSSRKVTGANWRNTRAVNTAVYHAKVELTANAYKQGWRIDEANSQLECDLIITQRPINLCSYHNNKVYDGQSNGEITNIQIGGDTPIVPGDVVKFNTTSVNGYYTQNGKTHTIHSSDFNNSGNEWMMQRDEASSELYIVHDNVSDPHYNYCIAKEDYTGAITSRGLVVHSRYLDDPDNPRNVKAYDGTNNAVIRDIQVDGVVKGDKVGIVQNTMHGTYATSNAGETLKADGTAQTDRFKKLQENKITPYTNATLTGNEYGDYYIAKEEYSGAIYRQSLNVRVKGWRGLYGESMKEMPTANSSYSARNPGTLMDWLVVDGLVGSDTLNLTEQQRSRFKTESIALEELQESSPKKPNVGQSPITYEEINENNFPVLQNYLVSLMGNTITIEQREIVITVNDVDKMVGDEIPVFHSTFGYRKADGEIQYVGDDENTDYSMMHLVNGDTVEDSVLVFYGGSGSDLASSIQEIYKTECTKDSPALYLDGDKLHDCAWCENYFGFKVGTNHWALTGYPVDLMQASQKPEDIPSLMVSDKYYIGAQIVKSPMGSWTRNYTITVVPGMLTVHPELRFQLKATVPMYVCMYGYRGDGEVVEPTNYGITNYSNGAIKVTDVTVSEDGWRIVDKAPKELLKGEMSMNMNGLQLVSGSNDMSKQLHKWVIGKDASADKSGQFKLLPLKCYIAGGNVNAANHSFVTKVKYTIEEYGITLPEGEKELPPQISGQPVNP